MSVEHLVTVREIEELFVSVLKEVTGEPVINEAGSGTQPGKAYCSISLLSAQPHAHAESRFVENRDGEFVERSLNKAACTLQIAFWGKRAYSRALQCQGHIMNNRRFFDLWRVIGFGGLDPVQSVNANYLGKIQERAHFNLNFHAAFVTEYGADYFEYSGWKLRYPAKPYEESLTIPKE